MVARTADKQAAAFEAGLRAETTAARAASASAGAAAAAVARAAVVPTVEVMGKRMCPGSTMHKTR